MTHTRVMLGIQMDRPRVLVSGKKNTTNYSAPGTWGSISLLARCGRNGHVLLSSLGSPGAGSLPRMSSPTPSRTDRSGRI